MKAVYPYNLRLLTIFNQKNKVRLVKFKIINFQVKMVLHHFNLKISQYNKIFLRKKLLKMKAVYPYNLRLLTIFNQKNKVRLAKFKITNFQVKMVLVMPQIFVRQSLTHGQNLSMIAKPAINGAGSHNSTSKK